jgi:chemotaxis protein MotB
MRGDRLLAGGVLCAMAVMLAGGCVSFDKYNRLKMANRRVTGEKEQLTMELYDARSVTTTLRERIDSLEGEVATKDELLANLRHENDLLEQISQTTQAALEDMANKQQFADIAIVGPKLPEALDSALKQFAEQHPGIVTYDPRNGTVKWKSDLVFALGSDVVKDSTKASLAEFASLLKTPAATDFEIIVVGHTCTTRMKPETKAKHYSNWHLSAHRAIAVANVLFTNGYAERRVGVMGCGEFRPVADNGSEAGRRRDDGLAYALVSYHTCCYRLSEPRPSGGG